MISNKIADIIISTASRNYLESSLQTEEKLMELLKKDIYHQKKTASC